MRSCGKISSRAIQTRTSGMLCPCSMVFLSVETCRASMCMSDTVARPTLTLWSRRVSDGDESQAERELTVGVDFNNKIALVKYGRVFRGLKIKGKSSG